MATYFNPDDEAHKLLLPKTFREADELDAIAAQVERDVIRQYTQRVRSDVLPGLVDSTFVNLDLGLIVLLRGYQTDADDADTDPDLKLALRDTVADVIAWRIRKLHRDPTVATEGSDAGKSKTFIEADTREPFPPNWDFRLTEFDAREQLWSL